MTEFRHLEGVKGNGKLDAWRVDWHVIVPDPDNDLRDPTTPENRAHIEELKNSIELLGRVYDPFVVRKTADDIIYAIDGRMRLIALAELEAENRTAPEHVICLPEAGGTDRVARTVSMLQQSTARKNYDHFEVARGVRRLMGLLAENADEVAKRMNWKSAHTVKNYLDSLKLKDDAPELHAMVEQGKISLTEAMKLHRRSPEVDAGELMRKAEEEHKRLNKKGPVKVKPRHVKEVVPPKPKKPTKAEQREAEKRQQALDALPAERRALVDENYMVRVSDTANVAFTHVTEDEWVSLLNPPAEAKAPQPEKPQEQPPAEPPGQVPAPSQIHAGESAASPDTGASPVAGTGDGLDPRLPPSHFTPLADDAPPARTEQAPPSENPRSSEDFQGSAPPSARSGAQFFAAMKPLRDAFNNIEWDAWENGEQVGIHLRLEDAKAASAALNQAMGASE